MDTRQTGLAIQRKYVGSIKEPHSPEALAIKHLMVTCDNDFVPPLSFRESTTSSISGMRLDGTDIAPYFGIILTQKNIVAYNNDNVIAFLSFQHNYNRAFFPTVVKGDDIVNYISTIIVAREFRRLLVASMLYDFIEQSLPDDVRAPCVATRTWSTNESHIKLLAKRGYELTCTMHKDRRTSEGLLDSFYFCKHVLPNHQNQ